ncbi:MAG: hypothetical protein ACYC5K_07240, partial [Saccharofermentanales bacterium]
MRKKIAAKIKEAVSRKLHPSGRPRRSAHTVRLKIREKLFLVVLSILVFNLLATFVFAQTLIGRFYTYSKTRELLSYQSRIKSSYSDDEEKAAELIDEAEQKNITVLIFAMADTTATIEYFSRNTMLNPGQWDPSKGRYNPMIWINYAYSNNYIDRLNDTEDTLTIETNSPFRVAPGSDTLSINV